jgi:non-ribosomal peptide synthetase component F
MHCVLLTAVAQGASLTEAWLRAAAVAEQAAQATAQLVPKVGRARPLAEKSVFITDARFAEVHNALFGILDAGSDAWCIRCRAVARRWRSRHWHGARRTRRGGKGA